MTDTKLPKWTQIENLATADLHLAAWHPPTRTRLDPCDLSDHALTKSIGEHGVFKPLVVTTDDSGRLVVLDGARRLAAAVKLGIAELPCIRLEPDGQPDHVVRYWGKVQTLNELEYGSDDEDAEDDVTVTLTDLDQRAITLAIKRSTPSVLNVLFEGPDVYLDDGRTLTRYQLDPVSIVRDAEGDIVPQSIRLMAPLPLS